MFPALDELQRLLSEAAKEELLPRFARAKRTVKPDGSVVTEADLVLQERLRDSLRREYPEFAFLGEEMQEAEQVAVLDGVGRGFWCVDPLDGTSNFASGIPFFAISLALVVNRQPILGMVYDPLRQECFAAEARRGSWLNGRRLSSGPCGLSLNRCLAVVDFKRLSCGLRRRLVTRPPYSSQRNFGSVALEWCWLAAGRFQAYLHGRQKVWDYAAGSLILSEAGGCAETLDGEPIISPTLLPRSVVAASDQDVFTDWKAWLRAAQCK